MLNINIYKVRYIYFAPIDINHIGQIMEKFNIVLDCGTAKLSAVMTEIVVTDETPCPSGYFYNLISSLAPAFTCHNCHMEEVLPL